MQVYIEYAFTENFLLDAMLLYLAFCFMRKKARVVPLTIAASAGACFACIYALFSVPFVLTLIVKTLAGAAMCLIACAHIRERGEKRGKSERRKEIKGYFVYTAVFFALAAALCGIFYAIDYTGNKLKTWQIPVCVFFVAACQTTAKRIFSAKKYRRSRENAFYVREKIPCGSSDLSTAATGRKPQTARPCVSWIRRRRSRFSTKPQKFPISA